ncbi:MAG: CinA family protein [Pseudomonadota bacterium]
MYPDDILAAARELLQACRERDLKIVTAESCTGGLIAGALTEIAGSSDVVDGGFVTYSNAMKRAVLGVEAATLEAHGAVSEPVVREMVASALGRVPGAGQALGVAVSGVAGPGGGTADKPVGLVHFAAQRTGGAPLHLRQTYGDIGRGAVRIATVRDALALMRKALDPGG